MEDKDNINTNENINTDETDEEKSSSDKQKPPVYEFSISTLNRKLNEIKAIKKKKKNIRQSLSLSDENEKRINCASTTVDSVTIMINPSKLIKEHLSEIQLRAIGHTRAAVMYEKREKIIGYPVTILSSFITSAIMMSIKNDDSNDSNVIKYISLTLSILSFLFSISRDYLNYARKFQSHDLSSKLYTTLMRSTEIRLIKSHLDKAEKRDIFKDTVDQMSIIEQYEIPIPGSIDTKVRREHALIADQSFQQ